MRTIFERGYDTLHRLFKRLAAGDQRQGIEIALDGKVGRKVSGRPFGTDRLVDPDHIHAGLAGIGDELSAGALGKADHGHVGMTGPEAGNDPGTRPEEHTSELKSLMRIS